MLWRFVSLPPVIYLHSLKPAVEKLRESGVERIYNGHYSSMPLTLSDTDTMLSGMKQICAEAVQGEPFENMAGSGVEYTFGDWSVLCCSKTNLPA